MSKLKTEDYTFKLIRVGFFKWRVFASNETESIYYTKVYTLFDLLFKS